MPEENPVENPQASGDDAMKKLAFERDSAAAAAAKAKRELEDLRKGMPTDEQRARWADLEKQSESAEEERKRKAGEFDGWRTQITTRHDEIVKAKDRAIEEERQKTASVEKGWNDTLIGLSFAGATDLFGPSGQTVLLPGFAQAAFASHVQVVVDDAGNRSVVVNDGKGAPLIDPKTGAPLPFAKAMKELIESHPQKDDLLRHSGKVGSGSLGGTNTGSGGIDLTRLRPSDFRDPKVAQALRDRHANAGGMQIGTHFDTVRAK